MTSGYGSEFLFRLAEEVEIRWDQPEPVTDEAYLAFRNRYRIECAARDRVLRQHLADRRLLRAYLPLTDRTFSLAYRILWYVNELIVPDPIERVLPEGPIEDLEKQKRSLIRTLAFLARFRWAIDSRFLLFLGKTSLPEPKPEVPTEIKQFIDRNPKIVQELDSAVQFGMVRRPDSSGADWLMHQAVLDSGTMVGWHFSGVVGSGPLNSPDFVVGERLPPATIDSIVAESNGNRSEFLRAIREMYPSEAYSVLSRPIAAATTNSILVVDRQVEASILQAAMPTQAASGSDLDSLSLVLPYLENVDLVRLAALRAEFPAAFVEFRALLLDIVEEARTSHSANPMAWAAGELERRHAASERQLESEIKGFALRVGLGVSGMFLSGMASLVGWSIDPHALAPLGFLATGVLTAAGLTGSALQERLKQRAADPFFFLWKASDR